MEDAKRRASEATMQTMNPVHETSFEWTIDNVALLPRRVLSPSFPVSSGCRPRFRLRADYLSRSDDGSLVSVALGIGRSDQSDDHTRVAVEVRLASPAGDVYSRTDTRFGCRGGDGQTMLMSGVFGGLTTSLTQPKSYSRDDRADDLFPLRAKNLVGICNGVDGVFRLVNDTLVVSGTVRTHGCCVRTHDVAPDTAHSLLRKRFDGELLADFARAYSDSLMTDVELVVDDVTVRAHRFVLQYRSPVFQRMFQHDTSEKMSGRVQITDASPDVLEALVWHLYSSEVRNVPFDELCNLYRVADKYEVPPLLRDCSRKLLQVIDHETVCKVLMLADMHGDKLLTEASKRYLVQNFSEVKKHEYWDAVVLQNPLLAFDVLQSVFEHYPPGPAVIYILGFTNIDYE